MAENGIMITRVFDAPRERVWREWTDPEAFADWFGAPSAEVPLTSVAMDVRPGGTLRLDDVRRARAATRSTGRASTSRSAAPERLVLTITDQPGEDARTELVTVVLSDLGDGRTEMHFEQRGSLPPEMYERTRAGWGGFFDRVAERLA